MRAIFIISFYQNGTWFYDEGRYLDIAIPSSIYYWIVVQKVFSLLITIIVYCGVPWLIPWKEGSYYPRIFLDLPRRLTESITNGESYGSVQNRNLIFVTEIDCF